MGSAASAAKLNADQLQALATAYLAAAPAIGAFATGSAAASTQLAAAQQVIVEHIASLQGYATAQAAATTAAAAATAVVQQSTPALQAQAAAVTAVATAAQQSAPALEAQATAVTTANAALQQMAGSSTGAVAAMTASGAAAQTSATDLGALAGAATATVPALATLATGTQGAIAAMGASATAAQTGAEGLAQLATAAAATASAVVPLGGGLTTLVAELQQAQQAAAAPSDQLRLLSDVLTAAAAAAEQGVVPLQAQAAALAVVAQAARDGAPGLQGSIGALEAMATQLANNIPLTQAQVAQLTTLAASMGTLTPATQGVVTAMDASATAAKTSAEEMARLGAAYINAAPAIAGVAGGIATFMDMFQRSQEVINKQGEVLQAYVGVLAAVAVASQQGLVPLQAQAAALSDMAKAAQEGVPGLQGSASALEAMAAQLAAGIPLTQAQSLELQGMAKATMDANREALGLGTALEVLAREAQVANTAIRESYQGLQLLSTQLTAGQKVTKLQADALKELADRAREGNGFTKAQADTLAQLSVSMHAGAVATKEQADALQKVTVEYAEANKGALGLRDATEENASAFDRFKIAALAVAAVLVELGREAFNYAKNAVEGAARVEVLGTVMGVMAKNANLSRTEMQVQVEQIKALGITTKEATDAVIKFVQAQLKITDASKLARVAQDLAVVAGINSSDAFKTLTQAIESQHVIMLRQFGIVTSLHEVYDEYAKSIGKTSKGLDEVDKKQAFLNKVLEEGAKVSGAYVGAMGDVGKQFTSLDRLFEEVSETIGAKLLPIFRIWVQSLTFLLEMFLKLPEPIQRVTAALLDFVAAMGILGGIIAGAKFLGIGELFSKVAAQAKLATQAVTALRTAQIASNVASAEGAVQLTLFGTATGEAAKAGGLFAGVGALASRAWVWLAGFFGNPWVAGIVLAITAIAALTAAIVALNKEGKKSVDELRKEFADIEKHVQPVVKLADAVEKLRVAQAKTATSKDPLISDMHRAQVDEYNKQLGQLKDKLEAAGVGFNAATGSADELKEGIKRLRDETDLAKLAMLYFAGIAVEEAKQALDEQQAKVEGLRTELKILADAHGDVNVAIQLTRDALAKNKDAISGQTGVWQDLWTILKNSVIITYHELIAAVKDAGATFVWFAERVGTIVYSALEKLSGGFKLIGLDVKALGTDVTDLWNKLKNFSLVDLIHKRAQESTVAADFGNVVGGSSKDVNARLEAAKKERARLQHEYEETQRFQEEAAASAATREKALVDARDKAFLALGRNLTTDPGGVEWKKQVAKFKGETARLFQELQTGMREYNEKGEKLKVAIPIDLSEFPKIVTEMKKQMGDASAAADKEAKKMATAMKSFMDSLSDKDPLEMAKFAAADKYLGEAGVSADEYARRVGRLKTVIDNFVKSSDPHIKAMQNIAAASKHLSELAGNAAAEKAALDTEKLQGDLDARTEAMRRGHLQELENMEYASANKLRDIQESQAERVRVVDEQIFEASKVSKMKAVDQAIYAENKKTDAVLRAYDREKLLRDRALENERHAVDEKARLAEEEIKIFVDKENRLADLAVARARAAAEKLGPGQQREDALEVVRRLATARETDRAILESFQSTSLAMVERHKQDQQQILDKTATTNAAIDASNKDLSRKQIAESVRMVGEIKKAYSLVYQFGKDLFKGVGEAFVGGLTQMLEGVKHTKEVYVDGVKKMIEVTTSFRDVMVGVWQSIKNSILNFFQQILQDWLRTLAKMAAAKFAANLAGGSSAVSSALSLFGTGAGSMFRGAAGASATASASQLAGTSASGYLAGGSGAAAAAPQATTLTATQGALVVGAASYFGAAVADKVFKKWIDGSTAKGILVGGAGGAAAGAAAGAAVGGTIGPWGALIGLGVGALKGWWDARKAREEMKASRNEFISEMGGLEAFKKAANEAGFAYEKFLNTKSPKEFASEVAKLKTALDALALKKAREELIATAGGMDKLQRSMQLVNFDSKTLFNTTDIKVYNEELEKLNKLLEAQQKRLAGLQTAATGLQQWATGFAQSLEKGLKKVFPTDAEFKSFQDHLQAARDTGFTGTIPDFLKDDVAKVKKDGAAIQAELAKIDAARAKLSITATHPILSPDEKKQLDQLNKDWDAAQKKFAALSTTTGGKLAEIMAKGQKEFTTLGLAATKTFAQIVHETGDIVQAMNAVAPSLDILIQAQKDWGFEADVSFGKLLKFRGIIKDNEDIFNSVSGITQVIKGLGEAGALTAEDFNAFGGAIADKFAELKARTGEADLSLLAMQPSIQALWEAQKQFGFQTDEATQALIDQGVTQGIVGDQFQSINGKMLDILVLIATTLGATIPEAYKNFGNASGTATAQAREDARKAQEALDKVGKAGTDAGGRVEAGAGAAEGGLERLSQKAIDARRRLEEMGAAGETAGQQVEDGATGAAEGSSPTGIKQIIVRLKEAQTEMANLAGLFATKAAAMEGQATSLAGKIKLPDVPIPPVVPPVPDVSPEKLAALKKQADAMANAMTPELSPEKLAALKKEIDAALKAMTPDLDPAQLAKVKAQAGVIADAMAPKIEPTDLDALKTQATAIEAAAQQTKGYGDSWATSVKDGIDAASAAADAAAAGVNSGLTKAFSGAEDAAKQMGKALSPEEILDATKATEQLGDSWKLNVKKAIEDATEASRLMGEGAVTSGDKAMGATDGAKDAVDHLIERLKDARRYFEELGAAAILAGSQAEGAMGGAAEGHSPTGIKQIVVRLKESIGLMHEFADVVGRKGRLIEGIGAQMANALPDLSHSDLQLLQAQRPSGTGETPQASPVNVTVTSEVHLSPTFHSFDPAGAKKAWTEHMEPEVLRRFDNNTDQIAQRVSAAVNKYRSNSGKR